MRNHDLYLIQIVNINVCMHCQMPNATKDNSPLEFSITAK